MHRNNAGHRSIIGTWAVICITAVLVAGCAPVPAKYTDNVQSAPLDPGDSRPTRVLASVEEWRDSGVLVNSGASYQISADGRWRTYGTCNWTGPDGLGLYNGFCVATPLYPQMLPGWSHSALIGKVGADGELFGIGKGLDWTAPASGTLLFRINDTIGANFDNEGYVDVTVNRVGSGSSKMATSAAAAQVVASLLEKRVALVIGNGDYPDSPLQNPPNDARAMAATLKQLGFDVTLLADANQRQMEEAIDKFGRKISGKTVALFFFAGHGVQVDGENYLIPVNADIRRQSDVRYKAVNVGQALGAMSESGPDSLNIVILDACRNNPLPRSFRSASRGLARLEGPKGTIIGFATSPGSVAADGEGENGVYTKYLLRYLPERGLTVEQVFKRVLRGVSDETGGAQVPWVESSFTGDFSFAPR